MTVEEKARAYDEALEKARKIHNEILNNEIIGFPGQIREIFPQLIENEHKIKSAIDLIAEERERQVSKGFNWKHDDEHDCHQLSDAAIVYAAPAPLRYQVMNWWPWDKKWLKEDGSFTTEGRIRELVKAGALIVAEIERLQRTVNNVTKPNESEDERIRRTLAEYFGPVAKLDLIRGVPIQKIRDWLEKQKENHDGKKWIYEDEYNKELDRIYNDGKDEVLENPEKYGLLKEQLTPETIHPKFAVGDTVCRPMWSDHTIRGIYVRCNDPVYVCVNEEGTESHISFSEQDEWERKEQKPAEWNDTDMKEARDNLISVCRDWERGKKTTLLPIVAVSARFFLEHLTEPKEWSEDIIQKSVEEVGPTQHQIDWFKTNVFPPKQEWSEEDEKMRQRIIRHIESEYQDWCKDKYGNSEIISDGKESCRERIAWLKSLRPSWKPSEEQMEALRRTVNKLAKTDVADSVRLSIMYDNLKRS